MNYKRAENTKPAARGAAEEDGDKEAEGKRSGAHWCSVLGEVKLSTVASVWGVYGRDAQAVLRRIWPGGSRSAGSGWCFKASSICLP